MSSDRDTFQVITNQLADVVGGASPAPAPVTAANLHEGVINTGDSNAANLQRVNCMRATDMFPAAQQLKDQWICEPAPAPTR